MTDKEVAVVGLSGKLCGL